MQQALHVARDILSGKVTPIEGGTKIAWFGSGDCYDFHVRGNTRRLIQGEVGFPDLVCACICDR
jgi:hypothetical protein